VSFRRPINIPVDEAHPIDLTINTDYRFFMAYFVGPFTSTYYTRIYCERNSDYTPIFRDFRLNGYIPPPPGPEDEEDEDEYEDECEFDKYIYEEE